MKCRVLVVDDSVVMRRLIRQALERDPELEVAGVAANGKIALSMVKQQAPDVITMEIEMPELDGLQTLRELRVRGIRTPVIMFSTLTERGALATLDALAAGADDYVAKPVESANPQESVQRFEQEVIPRIKALCWGATGGPPAPEKNEAPVPGARQTAAPREAAKSFGPLLFAPPEERIDIVAIGASTGGPNALTEVLRQLPADFAVPIVIVQHMPPTFTRFLAERLSTVSSLSVREGIAGAPLEAGTVWIAPGDFHMELQREASTALRLGIVQTPPENSCRPSVDVLFRSVARYFRNHALAVVLTGMGQDGLRGCEHIKEAQGQVIAQDEATSVVWGMPGFVARAGLADRVLPLGEIAGEIVRRVHPGRRALDYGSVLGGRARPGRGLAQGGSHGA